MQCPPVADRERRNPASDRLAHEIGQPRGRCAGSRSVEELSMAGRRDGCVTGTIAGVHRLAVWPTCVRDAVGVHRLVQQLCGQGFHATELTPGRRSLSPDVDMIVVVGDPACAVDYAITARRPLLATHTAAQAVEALAATDVLSVEHHLVVLTRADNARHRVVLATAQITPLDPLGTLTVEAEGSSASGRSAGLVTADPFDLLGGERHRPSRPAIRVEDATRQWGPPLEVDHRTTIIVRSCRPGTHLRLVSDAGRHAALASRLEIGPTLELALVRP